MILRSIRVENWRCFLEPVEVGPFVEGLNILHAPNATGKSTLFEALRRGLIDGHRVSGTDVNAIRPWGRPLAPTVTVEFFHEGADYRITKRFLDNSNTLLERKEDSRFVRLAENDAADEHVRRILTRNPPGRGLARPENWGLAQILWAPQGDLAFAKLSGDVLADIRTSLGAQVSGTGAGPVEKRIRELYLQFFTPKGKPKTGKGAPLIAQLEEKYKEALDNRTTALSQQQAFEDAARRVEDLRARRAQAKRDSEDLNKALKDARSQAESYRSLLAQKKLREERLKTAQAQYNELKQRIDAIQSARNELKSLEEALGKLKADMPLQVREVENREKEATEAKAALENIRKNRKAVDDAQELAELAHRFLVNRRTLIDLDKRIKKIIEAQEILDGRKSERSNLVAPDDKTLRAVRQAIKKRDDAQVRIESALITLEIVPEKDGSLEVILGEEPGPTTLRSGSPTQVKGSPEVVADLPGVARLRAWGPTGSIEEYRKEQTVAEDKIKRLTEPFGTNDLRELETLNEKAKELDTRIAEAKARLGTLLSNDSLEDIEQERSKVKALLEKTLEQHSSWRNNAPDSESLKAAAEESKRSFIEKVESAESRRDASQSAFTSATTQKAEIVSRLEGTKTQIESLKSRTNELTSDGKQDAEREAKLKELMLKWDAARASLDEIEKQLSEFGGDPAVALEKLEKRLDAADTAATKALAEEKSEEGRLEHLSAQGPYSKLARAEEEEESLKRKIEAEKLRRAAIGLVHNIVAQCRTEALSAVAGPVEAEATRTLERIGGRRLGSLRLGESFEPAHVVPEIAESTVSLDSVSGGEREQIYLATRLALAKVLARNERQLVVLDDVLTFTDTGRLARVMTVLEESVERLQLLILTCHPARYRGLKQAHFVDLEAIVRADTYT